jgi:hypothetical protein
VKTKAKSKKARQRAAGRAKPAARAAAKKSKPKKKAAAPQKAKPTKKAAAPKPKNKAAAPKKKVVAKKKKGGSARQARADTGSRWLDFVRKHGVVLASARGPVPSLASEVAGEDIVGSWWSHPKAQVIFETLSAIDDDVDVRCFKLVDGKVTFVHRRVWPALVCLAREGMLAPDRVASFQQEHMPTGEHRNLVTPFPEWVPEDVAAAAEKMTVEQARFVLGPAI